MHTTVGGVGGCVAEVRGCVGGVGGYKITWGMRKRRGSCTKGE